MFKFAIKNLKIKMIQVILIALSITISACVAVLSYNVATQVSEGITNSAAYYSVIIGPSGSSSQLAMNTMYFTDEVVGTIPYDLVITLQKDSRVNTVIPYAMADNYNGYNLVGTTANYLNGKEILQGEMFADDQLNQVVVGYNVAKTCQLSVGDTITTSHSLAEEHHTPFTVVGILKETHTSFDNVVFTELKTIWAVHEESHEEIGEENEHEELHNMVCAILLKTKNPTYAAQIASEYNNKVISHQDGDSYSLQAFEPMAVVRNILEDTNSTKYIVYILCGIILVMNVIIISVITLLNMYNSKSEIQLMRLIGISMKKINLIYVIQNGFIGLISTVLALVFSKVSLFFLNDFVSSMGVVVNYYKVYPFEIAILLIVLIIAVLPTVICTYSMSRKDSTNE